jgi:ParB-like chromosome segregation protein Spo0J
MRESTMMSEVDIGLLKPNPWNTNRVDPENEKKLKESFKQFGCYKPIVVRELDDGRYQILGGEHRWRTAKELGYDTVPIVNLGKIDDAKAKKIGLVDNGRYGEDDTLQLAELLRGLGDMDDVLAILPYQNDDLAAIFASTDIDLDSLDLPPEDPSGIPELPSAKAVQTHQVMRFKVPLEDAPGIQKLIEKTMKAQGYTDDDSMTNAGNALVHILKELL